MTTDGWKKLAEKAIIDYDVEKFPFRDVFLQVLLHSNEDKSEKVSVGAYCSFIHIVTVHDRCGFHSRQMKMKQARPVPIEICEKTLIDVGETMKHKQAYLDSRMRKREKHNAKLNAFQVII